MAVRYRLIDGYLDYLSHLHEINDNYVLLYRKMNEIAFICRRDMDQNRIQDAKDFRDKIAKQFHIAYNTFIPISCLELLLSLSERFAGTIFCPNDPDFEGTEEIFSLFIENLGLLSYDDNNFDEAKVEKVLNKWMNLEYNMDGTNGNIIAKPGYRKLKTMDIWMQLNATIYPTFERSECFDTFPVTHPYVN